MERSSLPARPLLALADRVTAAQAALDVAYVNRRRSPAARQAWSDSADTLRKRVGEMYPESFRESLRQLQSGDSGAVEPMLGFLEADPWCFRSGYFKADIVRFLKRHQLRVGHRNRLTGVLVNAVDSGDRREFNDYCKLAGIHAQPELTELLEQRLGDADPGIQRRALVMLVSVSAPPFTDSVTVAAREIIHRGAQEADDRHAWNRRWRDPRAKLFLPPD